MKIAPNYHFDGRCAAALELYSKAFRAPVTVLLRYRDADPRDMPTDRMTDADKDRIYHAEMSIGGQRFMFSDSQAPVPQGQNISMVVLFDHPDGVRAAFNALAEGGQVICSPEATTYSGAFGSVVDRFGMRWELMTENG